MRHPLALGLTSAPGGAQPHRAAEPNRAEMHISWFVELLSGCINGETCISSYFSLSSIDRRFSGPDDPRGVQGGAESDG